jgi:type II secretory pathway pseudopilin PulG
MTRNRSLFVAIRARLHDEHGFSLLETILAVTVMFTSLTALAYTATLGFGYQDLSRQRQAANGIANELMEQTRGLAYAKIQAGLLSTDLTGDANVVNCAGTSRFISCTADPDDPGSGEKVVTTPGLSTTVPLVPHRSSTAPNADIVRDGITYQWSTYVTQNDAVANSPYRVTVIVTYSGGLKATAPNKIVRVQSLFWSPSGCRSTDTHPFAAPCQPFLFGAVNVPAATVSIAGSIDQTTFSSGLLYAPRVSSSAQEEQVSQAQGDWVGPAVDVTDGLEPVSAGGTSLSTTADSDAGTSPSTYSRAQCPTNVTCEGGSVSSSGGGNSITLTAPAGATADSTSTTAASGANICPPPSDTAETDGLRCAGGRIQQAGDLTAVLALQNGIGSATLAQLKASGVPSKTFVHRTTFPSSTGCSPTSGADGCMAMSASRTLGTVNVGGLPTGFTAPAGWAGASAWNGYFLSITGYQDSLTGSVGTQSPIPTGSLAGTLYYYNGSGYTSVSVTDAALTGLSASYTTTQTISSTDVTVTISTEPTGMSPGSTSLTPTSPAGNATRTDVTARAIPPSVTVHYTVAGPSVTYADLTITVLLGTLQANGSYAAAPAQGT